MTKDDQHFRAWEHLHNYISGEPRGTWEITLKLIAAANSESLVYIATGPLEDLLYSHAEVFVDDVERLLAAGVPIRFIDDEWPSCEPKGTGDGGET